VDRSISGAARDGEALAVLESGETGDIPLRSPVDEAA